MPSLSTTQLKHYLPPSLSVTTTTPTSTSLPSSPRQPHLQQSTLSQRTSQQPSNEITLHQYPASISRWLPDSSTFVIKSYLTLRNSSNKNNHPQLELVTQNYCLLHKTYYAYSWCPSCQTHIIF